MLRDIYHFARGRTKIADAKVGFQYIQDLLSYIHVHKIPIEGIFYGRELLFLAGGSSPRNAYEAMEIRLKPYSQRSFKARHKLFRSKREDLHILKFSAGNCPLIKESSGKLVWRIQDSILKSELEDMLKSQKPQNSKQ